MVSLVVFIRISSVSGYLNSHKEISIDWNVMIKFEIKDYLSVKNLLKLFIVICHATSAAH